MSQCDECKLESNMPTFKFKGKMMCDGCHQKAIKQGVDEWGSSYNIHRKSGGKVVDAPRLSNYIN